MLDFDLTGAEERRKLLVEWNLAQSSRPQGRCLRKLFLKQAGGAPNLPLRHLIEEGLAAVWSQVLRLDRVGIVDNYFDLSGHSLVVVK